jgi:hypothetical protein
VKRTYVEKGVEGEVTTVDEVLRSVPYKLSQATPISTLGSDGKELGLAYYEVTDRGVYLVANIIEKPYESPVPMIELDNSGRGSWKRTLQVGQQDRAEVYRISGECRLAGTRDVLGKKVEVCEVKTTLEVGGGNALERTNQTLLYGKGVGLIEMTSVSQLGKERVERKLRLTKIEPGR